MLAESGLYTNYVISIINKLKSLQQKHMQLTTNIEAKMIDTVKFFYETKVVPADHTKQGRVSPHSHKLLWVG